MSEPIKPKDVIKKKQASIPPEVFDAFNELIAKSIDGMSAVVKQSEVVKLVLVKLKAKGEPIKERDIYSNHWLDVECSYRKAGWKVDYDKPGYNESYEATFKFTAPVTRG